MKKQAFSEFQKQTKTSILNCDTLFMVNYFNIETAQYLCVVWNRTASMLYQYSYRDSLTVKNSAKDWIEGYRTDFRRWVETADTAAYNAYGKKSPWSDAPSTYFTVAINKGQHWKFIGSQNFGTNVDSLER